MARDLYTSPLFRGRRAWVERTCNRWFILSAKHGLIAPHSYLEPYDERLKGRSAALRREWAAVVLKQVDANLGPITGAVFEVHAGAEYRNYGLVEGLARRGARVEIVGEHLGIGQQLSLYLSKPRSSHER